MSNKLSSHFEFLKKPDFYVQILLVLVGFALGYGYDKLKQNKDERERDAAIVTAYKMELTNNIARIQMNLNILRQPMYSTNVYILAILFQYRNTGLDLIRQRIPTKFVEQPTTLDLISGLVNTTDNANEYLRLRNTARLASAIYFPVDELRRFDKSLIDIQTSLLSMITNVLIHIGRM